MTEAQPKPYQLREGGASDDASIALSVALNNWFTSYGPSVIFKTCENCKFMAENGPAYCSLWNVTPPASVICSGCPSHQDKQEIPF